MSRVSNDETPRADGGPAADGGPSTDARDAQPPDPGPRPDTHFGYVGIEAAWADLALHADVGLTLDSLDEEAESMTGVLDYGRRLVAQLDQAAAREVKLFVNGLHPIFLRRDAAAGPGCRLALRDSPGDDARERWRAFARLIADRAHQIFAFQPIDEPLWNGYFRWGCPESQWQRYQRGEVSRLACGCDQQRMAHLFARIVDIIRQTELDTPGGGRPLAQTRIAAAFAGVSLNEAFPDEILDRVDLVAFNDDYTAADHDNARSVDDHMKKIIDHLAFLEPRLSDRHEVLLVPGAAIDHDGSTATRERRLADDALWQAKREILAAHRLLMQHNPRVTGLLVFLYPSIDGLIGIEEAGLVDDVRRLGERVLDLPRITALESPAVQRGAPARLTWAIADPYERLELSIGARDSTPRDVSAHAEGLTTEPLELPAGRHLVRLQACRQRRCAVREAELRVVQEVPPPAPRITAFTIPAANPDEPLFARWTVGGAVDAQELRIDEAITFVVTGHATGFTTPALSLDAGRYPAVLRACYRGSCTSASTTFLIEPAPAPAPPPPPPPPPPLVAPTIVNLHVPAITQGSPGRATWSISGPFTRLELLFNGTTPYHVTDSSDGLTTDPLPTPPGSYPVELTACNQDACTSRSTTLRISALQIASFTVPAITQGSPASASWSISGSYTRLELLFNDTNLYDVTDSPDGLTTDPLPTPPGSYPVKLTACNHDICTSSQCSLVILHN